MDNENKKNNLPPADRSTSYDASTSYDVGDENGMLIRRAREQRQNLAAPTSARGASAGYAVNHPGTPQNRTTRTVSGGTVPAPRTNGASPLPRTNGASPLPRANGTSPAPRANGTSPAPHANGVSPAPRANGASPVPRANGVSPAPHANGVSPAPRANGASPAPRANGVSPAPRGINVPPPPRMNNAANADSATRVIPTAASRPYSAPQNDSTRIIDKPKAENRSLSSAPKPARNIVPAQKPAPVQNSDATMVVKRQHLKNQAEKEVYAPMEKQTKKDKKKKKKVEYRSNTLFSILLTVMYIVMILVVSLFLSIFIIRVGNDVFAFVKSDEVVEVAIPEYATLDEMTNILAENGIIDYPEFFKFYANVRNHKPNYVAGTYTVSPAMNYDELLAAFLPKKKTGTVRITIPEGYTTDEIIDLFVAKGIGTKEGFVDAINNYDFDYWFVDELDNTELSPDRFYRLDGYLFPDTYDFYLSSSEVTVLNKLLKRFGQMYGDTYRERAAELGMTVDDVVILASMVEKETKYLADFPYISSVFHNRLKKNSGFQYLESDATIVYAMHHNTGTRPTTLTGEDTKYESPYNTYTNKGLPPGPIANPGYNALSYALYPAKTDYYYFVSNTKGQTFYASTLLEHEDNIRISRGEAPIHTGADAPDEEEDAAA